MCVRREMLIQSVVLPKFNDVLSTLSDVSYRHITQLGERVGFISICDIPLSSQKKEE